MRNILLLTILSLFLTLAGHVQLLGTHARVVTQDQPTIVKDSIQLADATLFTGKAKIEKVLSNLSGPKAANKFVYFVNHDWNLPIGYVFLTPDEIHGWKKTIVNVAFWVRGEYHGGFRPHLFIRARR